MLRTILFALPCLIFFVAPCNSATINPKPIGLWDSVENDDSIEIGKDGDIIYGNGQFKKSPEISSDGDIIVSYEVCSKSCERRERYRLKSTADTNILLQKGEDGVQTLYLKRSGRTVSDIEGALVPELVYGGMGQSGLKLTQVWKLDTKNSKLRLDFLPDVKWINKEGKIFADILSMQLLALQAKVPVKSNTRLHGVGFLMTPGNMKKWYEMAGKTPPSEPRFDVTELRVIGCDRPSCCELNEVACAGK